MSATAAAFVCFGMINISNVNLDFSYTAIRVSIGSVGSRWRVCCGCGLAGGRLRLVDEENLATR